MIEHAYIEVFLLAFSKICDALRASADELADLNAYLVQVEGVSHE